MPITPLAVLPRSAGMVKGDTRGRSGLAASFSVSRSKVSMPPNAVPTMQPMRSGEGSSSGTSASRRAIFAAATAKWVNRSLDLTFFTLVKYSFGSKSSSDTSLAMEHVMYWASNRDTGPSDDVPSTHARKKFSCPMPAPDTTPRPVTTTRRSSSTALIRTDDARHARRRAGATRAVADDRKNAAVPRIRMVAGGARDEDVRGGGPVRIGGCGRPGGGGGTTRSKESHESASVSVLGDDDT
mmetsp:Transcript_34921/g.68754  ORF Transcript_34921/g.68754 Transcript_34921/m.68754 type:complete len:240 (-) Transcript_34921:33-752(-)